MVLEGSKEASDSKFKESKVETARSRRFSNISAKLESLRRFCCVDLLPGEQGLSFRLFGDSRSAGISRTSGLRPQDGPVALPNPLQSPNSFETSRSRSGLLISVFIVTANLVSHGLFSIFCLRISRGFRRADFQPEPEPCTVPRENRSICFLQSVLLFLFVSFFFLFFSSQSQFEKANRERKWRRRKRVGTEAVVARRRLERQVPVGRNSRGHRSNQTVDEPRYYLRRLLQIYFSIDSHRPTTHDPFPAVDSFNNFATRVVESRGVV